MTVSFESLHSDREIVSRCWRVSRGIDNSSLPLAAVSKLSIDAESNEL